MTPPMHPLCASRLHAHAGEAPCEEQWQRHLDGSLRSRSVQGHVCPVGLRCACVPIYYGKTLLGVAKCVTDGETDSRRFARAVRILELTVSKACQDLCVSVRSDDLDALRERMRRLQAIRGERESVTEDRSSTAKTVADDGAAAGGSLVDRALDCIALHYLEHEVTLTAISRELGVTEKYLTGLFTAVVGQHMHAYILQLRIQHACRAILASRTSIKQVAYESGFNGVDAFRRSFRRYVGVAPGAYRSAFARD